MEIVLQWLDDLDDLIGAAAILRRRLSRLLLTALATVVAFSLPLLGVLLALSHPPLAMASALLMFVALMYHTVTAPLEIGA